MKASLVRRFGMALCALCLAGIGLLFQGCTRNDAAAQSAAPAPAVQSDPNVPAEAKSEVSAAKQSAQAQGDAYAKAMSAKYSKQH